VAIDAKCILQALDRSSWRALQAAAPTTPQTRRARRVWRPQTRRAPADADEAFTQVEKAVKPFWCSNAYSHLGDMAHAGNIDTMKLRVREYCGVMTRWPGSTKKTMNRWVDTQKWCQNTRLTPINATWLRAQACAAAVFEGWNKGRS
jgi:hypothetical protein